MRFGITLGCMLLLVIAAQPPAAAQALDCVTPTICTYLPIVLGRPPVPPTATPTATTVPPTLAPTITLTPTRDPAQCSPAYPTVCIPPPPPDLNCGDIPYRRFTVLPPDPHNFDGDGNGVGCESG
jgi:hypothetical protein